MKELKDTLWKAADKLRGSMDASQYKDVILGLVFLKYVSDAFDERREADPRRARRRRATTRSRSPTCIDDLDEYTGPRRLLGARRRPLVLPRRARQGHCPPMDGSRRKTIGQLIDEAMDALMDANPSLRGARCRGSSTATTSTSAASASSRPVQQRPLQPARARTRPATCWARSTSTSSRSSPAPRASGAASSTRPPSVVRVLVEVLEPTTGRVYDPCCGSGGMFVQAEKFLDGARRRRDGHLGLRPGAQRAHLAAGAR